MPSAPPRLTVALPVWHAPEEVLFRRAVDSIRFQTVRDLEILIVLNGSPDSTRRAAEAAAASDARIRVLSLPTANLAAALNHALENAACPLVARMDADDVCAPARLAIQSDHMLRHPDLAAVGCGWQTHFEDRVLSTIRPPTDPAQLRWRLLLGNCLAHGSMMLRRDAVLRNGGFDPGCSRSQDYELWMRLSADCRVGAVADVLYHHRLRQHPDTGVCTGEQAEVAVAAMLMRWRDLPPASGGGIESALRDALSGRVGAAEARVRVEAALCRDGPTREGLLARLWLDHSLPSGSAGARRAADRALLRETSAGIRAAGGRGIYLWGAGEHTRRLIDEHGPDGLDLEILGVVDDDRTLHGRAIDGLLVSSPDELRPGDHALLSSDAHEERMWARSAAHRTRGVLVHRLYTREPAGSIASGPGVGQRGYAASER